MADLFSFIIVVWSTGERVRIIHTLHTPLDQSYKAWLSNGFKKKIRFFNVFAYNFFLNDNIDTIKFYKVPGI